MKKQETDYLRTAFREPWNLLALGFFSLVSLLPLRPEPVVVVALVEVLYLLGATSLPFYRKVVDERNEEAERKKLLRGMDWEQENRARSLLELLAKIEGNIDTQGEAARTVLEDSLEQARRLVAAYVRLARSLVGYNNYLREVSSLELKKEADSLRKKAAEAGPESPLAPALRQRLSVNEKRAKQRTQTEQAVGVTLNQLETIAAMVSLMYEQSLSPRNVERFNSDMATFLEDLDRATADAEELETYTAEEEELPARVARRG